MVILLLEGLNYDVYLLGTFPKVGTVCKICREIRSENETNIMFRKLIEIIVVAAVSLLPVGFCTSCDKSSKPKAISVNQSNNRKEIPAMTPTNKINSNVNSEPPDLSKVETVSYCELIKNSARYNHKIVRIRAVYFTSFEQIYLYDDTCEIGKPPTAPEKVPAETWVELDKSLVTTGDSEEAKLNGKLKGFGRKDITVIGRFNSTNEQNDANAPNRFGHMGSCKFLFQIIRLEKIAAQESDEEAKTKIVAGSVDQLIESDDKVKVAVSPFAQMFFLQRSNPKFKEYLNLLKFSFEAKNSVRCVVSSNGGEILEVK
jgi:hypothetical protein